MQHGKWWTIVVWKDVFQDGKPKRKQVRVRLAPIDVSEKQAQRARDQYLRQLNESLSAIGSATNFQNFVEGTYVPLEMNQVLAITTQQRYRGVINNYLIPQFGSLSLGGLTPAVVQQYFVELGSRTEPQLSHESIDKIRDVLAAILRAAHRKYGFLDKDPMEHIRLPRSRTGKKKVKPHLTPEQFDELVRNMPEPYATMVLVAIFTGLRVSELLALRWGDLGFDSIVIDERYCRGDFSEPKSEASNTTIGVDRSVIERMHRLKLLTVCVRAGRAVRKYPVVKSAGPEDLIFQSVKDGKPMRDNNVLTRFIKPVGRKLGLGFVNWRCLRTSRATWMIQAGANPKDVQGQMRHSRIQTTLDIYAQFVPESQRQAIALTSKMVAERIANAQALRLAAADGRVN
jgi:integrase